MKPEIVTIGETMAMLAPPPSVRLARATNCQLHVAGAESNVAITLARLGHPTAWISRLGDDPLGERVLTNIRDAGVDVSGVVVDSQRSTGLFFKDPLGESTRVHYYRRGSAASAMSFDILRAIAAPPALIHLSGITPALSDSCAALVRHIIFDRPLAPARISFDVNYRPTLWRDSNEAAQSLYGLAAASDIVFVGLDEAEALWGCESVEDVRSLFTGVSDLIVKDAEKEAVWFSGAERSRVQPAPVEVIEVVGAGDSFAAGWLSGYRRGLPPRDRLRLAHYVAATSLRSTSDNAELPPFATIETELGLAVPTPSDGETP